MGCNKFMSAKHGDSEVVCVCLLIQTKAEVRRVVMPEEEEKKCKRMLKRKARGAGGSRSEAGWKNPSVLIAELPKTMWP